MLNIAQKPKITPKADTKPAIAKPKARKVMDPKDFKGHTNTIEMVRYKLL
jgi:hypothetical protein